MEAQDNQKDIFEISKDPEKKQFKLSHTYNNIIPFTPGQNSLYDSIIDNNRKNINNSNEDIFHKNQNKEKEIYTNETIIKNINRIKLRVILNYSYQKDFYEFCLPTKIIYNKEQNTFQFLLNDIIDIIESYANDKTIFLNDKYSISYYTNDENKNVNNSINLNEENDEDIIPYYFIGNFPLDKTVNYYINIPTDGVLYLKFRKRISKINSLRYDIYEEENEEENEDNLENNQGNAELNYNTKSKRAKEKKIGYIIRKVFEWKGFRKFTDNKMSLIDAAANVGLSKKTLDEYFNQIKEGKKYNFDFNKHKKDKVNILRGYVKKMNNNNMDGSKKIEKKRKTKNKKTTES